MTIKKN